MSFLKVRALREEIFETEKRYHDYIATTYPAGKAVTWERGLGKSSGHVLFPVHNRLKVRNEVTGKEYFIYATDLTT